MAQYRKRPVVIEAAQYAPLYGGATMAELRQQNQWLEDAWETDIICVDDGDWAIRTTEGVMKVSQKDWIVRGIAGELYPCKPNIFAATYEPVQSHQDALQNMQADQNHWRQQELDNHAISLEHMRQHYEQVERDLREEIARLRGIIVKADEIYSLDDFYDELVKLGVRGRDD